MPNATHLSAGGRWQPFLAIVGFSLVSCAAPQPASPPAAQANVTRDASCGGSTVPSVLSPGETREVSVTMKNTGNVAWTNPDKYRLGISNPKDSFAWGESATRVEIPVSSPVAPGGSYTFSFKVSAPANTGKYPASWSMVQDGVTWFGASCGPDEITIQQQ